MGAMSKPPQTNPLLEAQVKRLEGSARTMVGQPVWPFVVLDWFAARRDVEPNVDRVEHVALAREQLESAGGDLTEGLRSLLAISAELLGPDTAQIEQIIKVFLEQQTGGDRLPVSENVQMELKAVGLSSKAISRLPLEVEDSPVRTSPRKDPMALPVFISYSHEGQTPDGPWMTEVRSFAATIG